MRNIGLRKVSLATVQMRRVGVERENLGGIVEQIKLLWDNGVALLWDDGSFMFNGEKRVVLPKLDDDVLSEDKNE